MPFDRFMIAPFNSGLQTDVKRFLIPEDAFSLLNNAYVFRGRVKKRFGSRLLGGTQLTARFRIALTGGAAVGITDASGNATGTVPGAIFKVGQMFSIGAQLFTVSVLGTPAAMLNTGSGTGTYNTTTGVYTFTGATALTQIFFYPAEPVMGFEVYDSGSLNNYFTLGWDTQFGYIFTGGAWQRIGTTVWKGNNLNFFWATNFRGVGANNSYIFVTNFNATVPTPAVSDDPMYYYNGSTFTAFTPTVITASSTTIQTARIIVGFKSRLVLLNTVEQTGGTNSAYVNRARFSHVGDPTAANAFLEPDQTGYDGGGFIDAATKEQIISAEFIKDRLIVYFEASTWELAYTGNQVEPFIWQKINTELGAIATFSTVPFDQEVVTIGSTGVHSCNGANVVRIDNKIPDEIFDIKNSSGSVERVFGIRDYAAEVVYWSFPNYGETVGENYPNKILLYNYRNQTWANLDDCITAYGYFQQQTAPTWASIGLTWEQAGSTTWADGFLQPQPRQVIGGNQEGFTFTIERDTVRNAPAMQISNMVNTTILNVPYATLTIVDHTLSNNEDSSAPVATSQDYIAIENAQGVSGINVNYTTGIGIYPVAAVVDANTVVIGPLNAAFTGTYTGGGQATRVSNYSIISKQWNPYLDKDRNFYLQRIDFGVFKTESGQVTVDYSPSDTELSMIEEGQISGAIMGDNILETSPYDITLYPLEQVQDRLWHPIYFQTDGNCIEILIYMNDTQLRNPNIAWENLEIEAIILYTQPTTSRMQ